MNFTGKRDFPPSGDQWTSCLHRRTRNLENIPERRGRILVCGSGCRRLSLRLRDDGGLRCLCGTGGLDGAALLSGSGCWEDLRSSDGDVHSGCGTPARSSFSFDAASFQLSFLAVTSLVYPGRLFSARGEKIFAGERSSAAASAFFTSLSLQMVTAPVILWHSFGIPLYGVFLNLIVIPLMTYVVISGFLGLGLSFLSISVGSAMLGGAHYILRFYEFVCSSTGKLPWGGARFWAAGGVEDRFLLRMSDPGSGYL